jgi:uncharacterized GH25 family protein
VLPAPLLDMTIASQERVSMKRDLLLAFALCGLFVVSATAHDLFLKLDTYFLAPNSKATVRLMNGTFSKSEGKVARDRMQDVTILNPQGDVLHPPESNFSDEGEMTLLDLQTAGSGTYVVSVSTKPREIDLKAADFNDYLKHDGIPDILAARKRSGELSKDVRERYSKHVKAVFQVGDARTDNFKTPLNYPVEIIPQQNPYALKVGQTLVVQCLKDDKPIPNQFVMAGWESGNRESQPVGTRTDANGMARIKLKSPGKWYVKMIHMEPLNEPALNYESKWATLTFEIR